MRAPTLLFRVGAAQKPAGIPVLAGFFVYLPCVRARRLSCDFLRSSGWGG